MDQFQTFSSENKAKKTWWRRPGKAYIWILVISVSFILGIGVGQIDTPSNNPAQLVSQATNELSELFGRNSNIDPDLFKEVWRIVHNEYFDKNKISDQDLFYGAIEGMVAALDDPHTVFFNPKLTKDFNQELSGSFYGIGAEIGRKDGLLVIIAPLADTPSARAGLKSGDKILAINSKDATEYSVDQAISEIRGEKGSKVTLTILSAGDKQTRDVTLIRDKISVPSVTYRLDNKIAIVRVTSFNEDTATQFAKTIQKLLSDNPQSIVLDLRNNPGGYLETSVQLASYWLEPGQVIVREEFADKSQNQSHSAIRKPSISQYKTIVLINEGSASASEILAGALKDYNLATLVGKKTYGKGSVQNLLDLPGDSSIKITVAKWLTPKGTTIDGTGITPDVEVELTTDDYNNGVDPQLDKALELLKE